MLTVKAQALAEAHDKLRRIWGFVKSDSVSRSCISCLMHAVWEDYQRQRKEDSYATH